MVLFKAYVYFYLFIIHLRFPKSKSLHEVIRDRYGNETLKQIRRIERLDFKRKKSQLDLDFLLECQRRNVVPNFLYFKLANRRLQTSHEYLNCQRILLEAEIAEKRRNIRRIDKELLLKKSIALNELNYFDFNHVCHVTIAHNEKSIQRQSDIHKKKLSVLLPLSGYTRIKDTDSIFYR